MSSRVNVYGSDMDILLIAGLWLPASIWRDVSVELETLGHRALPVSLPGVDDQSTSATLDDQLEAALAAVDSAERPVVVGHSAASTLAWLVADRRPEAIRGAVMIGGFPSGHGSTYAEFFPIVDGVMAFPGWETFEGPDSDDLDQSRRETIESIAVPVTEGVASGVVELTDDRRFEVPITMVCPEYTPDQARNWLAAGQMPELERASTLSFVDIESGHWPMVTRPADLARIVDAIVAEA